jgi:hypothetical protein
VRWQCGKKTYLPSKILTTLPTHPPPITLPSHLGLIPSTLAPLHPFYSPPPTRPPRFSPSYSPPSPLPIWAPQSNFLRVSRSVVDPDTNPDPPDPHVFGPPGSGSGCLSQRYGSGSGSRSPDPDLDPSITKQKK